MQPNESVDGSERIIEPSGLESLARVSYAKQVDVTHTMKYINNVIPLKSIESFFFFKLCAQSTIDTVYK